MKYQLGVVTLSLATALGFGGASSARAQQCSPPVVSFGTAPSGMLVGDVLAAAANVSSTCQIQSVVASIPGASAPMVYTKHRVRIDDYYTWDAALPASQLPYGPFTLTVTATDVFGNSGSATLAYKKDSKPSLSIVSPAGSALARPTVRVTASCADDGPGGCQGVKVYVDTYPNPTELASGPSIDQEVSLGAYDGKKVTLNFQATDSSGQTTTIPRTIYVESNPALVEVARVPGAILDDSSSSTLYIDDAYRVLLLNKNTGQTTTVFSGVISGSTYITSRGYLTPVGALLVCGLPNGYSSDDLFLEWRNDVLSVLARPAGAMWWYLSHVSGGYATFNFFDGSHGILRRDLMTGDTIEVTHNGAGGDLAASGDVVYEIAPGGASQIGRYRSGVTTTLTGSAYNFAPRTDGINVVYLSRPSTTTGNITLRHLSAAGVDTPLGGVGSWSGSYTSPLPYYQLTGGWTAYTVNANTSRNVWVRSPSGADTQLTFFNDAASIAALNDDGRVVVNHNERLSIVQSGAAARDVGSVWPTFWRNGDLFQIVGSSVLRLTTCTYAVSSISSSMPGPGGTGTVTVTAPSGCAWTAVANDGFETIKSGANGTGNGTVTYAVAANGTGATRTGTLTIAGRLFTVTQTTQSIPTVTWGNPAAIVQGTPLGSKQLNATASVPGGFVYTPPAGTVLGLGPAQTLSVTFTPTDSATYATVTRTVTINVVSDPRAPTGTVRVNGGASYTSDRNVTLTLAAEDDGIVADMGFSNDGAVWSAYEPYATTKSWTLISGDGPKTVYARFKDGGGNVSATASASIALDTVAPSGTLTLNGGAISTASPIVADSMSASDVGSGVADMSFSFDGEHWGAWVAYGPSTATTFAADAGVKTLFARFKDAAGNVSSSASDTIVLDPSVGSDYSVLVNGGVRFTNTAAVRLALGAKAMTSAMQVSNDPAFSGAEWEPYTTSRNWTIPASPAGVPRTVYARFRDVGGAVSATVQTEVVIDTVAPTGSVRSVNHPGGIVLELNAIDDLSGVNGMSVSGDPTFAGAQWEPYAATKDWVLEPGGVVYVKFKDAAGNTSGVVTQSGTTASVPFGRIDTPVTGSAGLQGSFAVTGWALDDAGIDRVELWRDAAPGETTPPYYGPGQPGHGKIFIANALLVDGARPDVEAQYPTLPQKSQAGWGYLLLSQGLWNQGNGTYTLYSYAYDKQGANALLGTTTITVDNAHATKPFGAIDTPGVGETVAGSFYNFGWALTPKSTPTCTIGNAQVQMSLDSRPLVTVNYGDLRPDIAGAFPGFSNAGGAGGSTLIDTMTLEDGVHQIGWLVYDNCGRGDGVGSRFFTVSNGNAMRAAFTAEPSAMFTRQTADPSRETDRAADRGAIRLRRLESDWEWVPSDPDGWHQVTVDARNRIELELPSAAAARYEAYQIVNGERRNLPLGSSFDASTGTFFWQPAPAFHGAFDLVFEMKDAGPVRVRVRVN